MDRDTVKIAAIQCHSAMGDVAGNLSKMTTLCEEAALAGAKIIVFPEVCVHGLMNSFQTTVWKAPDKAVSNRFQYVSLLLAL